MSIVFYLSKVKSINYGFQHQLKGVLDITTAYGYS